MKHIDTICSCNSEDEAKFFVEELEKLFPHAEFEVAARRGVASYLWWYVDRVMEKDDLDLDNMKEVVDAMWAGYRVACKLEDKRREKTA